jgi:uncharacterized Fe-S cluster-containing MiaB family protein
MWHMVTINNGENEMTNAINLTAESLKLFIELASDAGDWSGQPIIDISKEQRGNLSDLKKKNLLVTFRSDGCDWADFTPEGKSLAQTLGIDI